MNHQQHFTQKLLAGVWETLTMFSPSPVPWAECLVGTSRSTQLLACACSQGLCSGLQDTIPPVPDTALLSPLYFPLGEAETPQ